MADLGLIDWLIWLVYMTLFTTLLVVFRSSRNQNQDNNYYLIGFILKSLGGVAFVHTYIYYYGFGDTFLYFKGAKELSNVLTTDSYEYFQLLFSENGNLAPELSEYEVLIPYSRTAEEWFMVKLLSPFTLLSFNSYLVLTLFVSSISFYGSWKLYKVLADVWEKGKKWSFYAVFMIPSVFFWSTGVLKDSIAFAAINCLIFATYFILFKKKYSTGVIILGVISLYLLYQLKIYILFSFIPAVFVGFYAYLKYSIRSVVVRVAITPILFLVVGGFAYFAGNSLIKANEEYTAAGLEKQVKGFHSWHTTTAGSAYNLGEVSYTVSGVLQKVPSALNVTFFRPYLWESTNIVMLASAIESLVLLMLFLYVLFKWNIKLFALLRKKPVLQMFLVFILGFGFAVGFTSYNFGALVRYKIPIYSISYFLLIYLSVLKKDSVN